VKGPRLGQRKTNATKAEAVSTEGTEGGFQKLERALKEKPPESPRKRLRPLGLATGEGEIKEGPLLDKRNCKLRSQSGLAERGRVLAE